MRKASPTIDPPSLSDGLAAIAESHGRQIGPEDYDYICRLVYSHSRIKLGPAKSGLVSSRVSQRLRTLQMRSFQDYCKYLRSPAGAEELTGLVDVISTNVTDFFRERSHFEFLTQTALPRWTTGAGKSGDPFRVWSAACSSGEEPYSLAITLAEFFRLQPGGAWQVEASDISTRILERASLGVYRAERVKMPSPEWLSRYFQMGVGHFAGTYRVKKGLRDRVTFRHVNLFQASYPIGPHLDVIFCRNVMIYFDRPTQEELVGRLREQLRPGGFLIVGHSESLIGIQHKLETVQPSIYRRPT